MRAVGDKCVVKRRGTLQQGRALETLGHAVEYLLDSRMFLADCGSKRDSEDAVGLLKLASREVFAECPEVLPVRGRLGRWVAGRVRPAAFWKGSTPTKATQAAR